MAYNTIKIKKYSDVIEEANAAAAITPGHLIEFTSAGKVQKHSSAGGTALTMFALEDELQGKGISEAYSADNPVQCWVAGRGDMVYALVAAGATAITAGDFLESAGDGTLRKYASGVKIAQAVESVDNSASSISTEARIVVRIL